ncbi:MAG: BamA/TamA family outer membrane protein [Gemmatimonadota bacterium]
MHNTSLALFAFVLLLVPAFRIEAQEACPEGRVTEVLIENHSIFDPEDLPDEGRLVWAYELANRVHIRTREDFIASEILFSTGGCYDARQVVESARILREFRFIASAEVASFPAEEGNRRVVVSTRDEWTTKVRLGVALGGGIQFSSAAITEENLLGRGITLGLSWADRGGLHELGGTLEVPGVRGSDLDALVGVSHNRGGSSGSVTLIRPFVGELIGTAHRQRVFRRQELFAYVLPAGNEISHVTVPDRAQQIELSLARRFGAPGRLYLLGGGVSVERVDVGDGEIEAIRDGDFSNRIQAGSELTDAIFPQMTSRRAVRMNLLFGARRLEFQTLRGLDAVYGERDVPSGWEATITAGRSVGGAGGGDRPSDLFTGGSLLAGWARPHSVGQLRVGVEGRRLDATEAGPAGWRDVLVETQGTLFLTPEWTGVQSFVFRGAFHGGWRATSPFQITLGGPEGVRGFGDAEFPGGRRVVISIEARLGSPNPFPEFLDLGLTVFGDAGTVWGGDAPFGADSAWKGTLGAGLRVGFPAGSSSVIRFDLAYPVGRGAETGSPILRISAKEWIGVIGDTRNPQLARSRRSGIQSDYVGAARDEGAR